MTDRTPETTPQGADSELVELEAPPAPPTVFDRDAAAAEGEELAEDGAGTPPPAPSSLDTEEDEDSSTDPEPSSSSSSVSIRERMRQLEERDADAPGSPGFGVVGKFSEARADRDRQLAEDEDA